MLVMYGPIHEKQLFETYFSVSAEITLPSFFVDYYIWLFFLDFIWENKAFFENVFVFPFPCAKIHLYAMDAFLDELCKSKIMVKFVNDSRYYAFIRFPF